MNWNNRTILEFIKEYRHESVLWDSKHELHSDKQSCAEAWYRISNKLNISVVDMKRKRDSLMASYRCLVRRQKASINSSFDDEYKPTWFAFKAMDDFLGHVYSNGKESVAAQDMHPVAQIVIKNGETTELEVASNDENPENISLSETDQTPKPTKPPAPSSPTTRTIWNNGSSATLSSSNVKVTRLATNTSTDQNLPVIVLPALAVPCSSSSSTQQTSHLSNTLTFNSAAASQATKTAPSIPSVVTARHWNAIPELKEAVHQMKEGLHMLGTAIVKRNDTEEDECDLFGRILAKKLRKLPEEERDLAMYEIEGLLIGRRQERTLNLNRQDSELSLN